MMIDSKKSVIIILSTLLAVFIVAGNNVSKGNDGVISLHEIVLMLVIVLVTYILLSLMYSFFDYIPNNRADKGKNGIYLFSFALLVTMHFFAFCILYPGIFAFDAPSQLRMYLTGQISEWHPVLHTVILGKILEFVVVIGGDLIEGVALYSIIQIIVTDLCFAYLLTYVYKKCSNMIVWGVAVLFLGAFPTLSLQVLSVTKDSYFMCFFVLAMTVTVEIVYGEGTKTKDFLWIISVVLMMIFRNNCVYAIPILFLTMILLCTNKKRIIKLVICVILLFVLYKTVYVSSYITVKENGSEKLSVPSQQLVRIYRDDKAVLSAEDRTIIESVILEEGISGYVPESADIVKAYIDMAYYRENKSTVRKCWWRVISHNPKMAIRTVLDMTCGYWYPIHDLTLYADGTKGYWVVNCYYPLEMKSKVPSLLKYYRWFEKTDFSGGNIFAYLFCAPAMFFYHFLVMFGYSIIKRNKAFISVFLYTLVYWLTFMLGPMVLVRYTTYMYAIVPLYVVLIMDKNKGNKSLQVTIDRDE